MSQQKAARMNVAEFFAGIGLMRMGLEREGWTVTFANDIDILKYEMYRPNFKDGHSLVEDSRRVIRIFCL